MSDKIVVALDGLDLERACGIAGYITLANLEVGVWENTFKIHDLYDRYGQHAIYNLKKNGTRIWIDYKLHDVPTTVGHRTQALKDNGADIVTVHASGGVEMMKAAVDTGITVYAVTVLTSLHDYEVAVIYGKDSSLKVPELAVMAKRAGCHGIVCSPKEVLALSKNPELAGMEFVTPGIRFYESDNHDQARVATPQQALANGATTLVVGREITDKNPEAAYKRLVKCLG